MNSQEQITAETYQRVIKMLEPGVHQRAARGAAEVLAPFLSRLNDNLRRTNHLVSIYRDLYGKGSGKRSVHKTDLLRAAVVFLHASLEDLLRSLAKRYLPSSGVDSLNKIPVAAKGDTRHPEKVLLGHLSLHRGKTVDQLVDESIERHLEKASYNNTTDIASLLSDIDIEVDDELKKTFPQLQKLIERRHHIVHRADASAERGRGKQRARSISPRDIDKWIAVVRDFTTRIVAWIITIEMKARGYDLAELQEVMDGFRAIRKEGAAVAEVSGTEEEKG